MNRGTTPCSALTFVKNSADSLEACLQSALFCSEHVLLDAGSTDGTLALAEKYGCKVIPQDQKFLNGEGRIIDYAGITNQGIAETRHGWITIVDSDEHIDQALIDAMKKRVEGKPGACFVDRLYTHHRHVIQAASTYPNRQIRLFHKDAIDGFVKIVHERPVLKKGIIAEILPGIQYVPLDPIDQMRRKFLRYLDLETRFAGGKGYADWIRLFCNKCIRIALRIARILRDRLTHRPKDCLPFAYEWLHIWYPWQIVLRTFPPIYRSNIKRLLSGH